MGMQLPLGGTYIRSFYLVSTGLTPTISIWKNGAGPTTPVNSLVELAHGFYVLTLTPAELSAEGSLCYYFSTGTNSIDQLDQVLQTGAGLPVTVGTNNDKTGYSLVSSYDAAQTAAQAGDAMSLVSNAISDSTIAIPSVSTGPANSNGVVSMIYQLWRRFFKKTVRSVGGGTIILYMDDGTTPQTTQTYTSGAGGDTVNAAT
jgi:hypothetical protein